MQHSGWRSKRLLSFRARTLADFLRCEAETREAKTQRSMVITNGGSVNHSDKSRLQETYARFSFDIERA